MFSLFKVNFTYSVSRFIRTTIQTRDFNMHEALEGVLSVTRQSKQFTGPDLFSLSLRCYYSTDSAMPKKNVFERLPKSVKPNIYHILLKPDLKTLKFSGQVGIEVDVSCIFFLL